MDPVLTGNGEDRRCAFLEDETETDDSDGPALRALAMIPYAHFLLDRGWPADMIYVERHLYDTKVLRGAGSVIKNDLEEVGGGWWHETFDLWEEVYVNRLQHVLPS